MITVQHLILSKTEYDGTLWMATEALIKEDTESGVLPLEPDEHECEAIWDRYEDYARIVLDTVGITALP